MGLEVGGVSPEKSFFAGKTPASFHLLLRLWVEQLLNLLKLPMYMREVELDGLGLLALS